MLLFLNLALSFTGYLLPWDQLSFWAVRVGTNIASYAPLVGPKSGIFVSVATQSGATRCASMRWIVIAMPCCRPAH